MDFQMRSGHIRSGLLTVAGKPGGNLFRFLASVMAVAFLVLGLKCIVVSPLPEHVHMHDSGMAHHHQSNSGNSDHSPQHDDNSSACCSIFKNIVSSSREGIHKPVQSFPSSRLIVAIVPASIVAFSVAMTYSGYDLPDKSLPIFLSTSLASQRAPPITLSI